MIGKRTNGLGGYSAGTVMYNSQRMLSINEVRGFEKRLAVSEFWELPSVEQGRGFDGTECLIEAVHRDVYHLVERWSPRHSPFAELVQFMLELPKFDVDLVDVDVEGDGDGDGDGDVSSQVPKFLGSFAELQQRWNTVRLDDAKCQRCGRPIGSKRLQQMPFATHCWECQTQIEQGQD